jgi:hypothetical protein
MSLDPITKRTRSFAAVRSEFSREAPPAVFVVLLGASLLVRCGGVVNTDSTRRAASQEAGVTASGGGNGTPSGAAGSPGIGGVVFGVGGVTNAGGAIIVVPAPSSMPGAPGPGHCRPSAAAEDCPLPLTFCEDGITIAYYADPACPNGTCEWTRKTSRCGAPCMGGVCVVTGGPIPLQCSGSDASTCPLPPSVCLSEFQLLYFSDLRCVDDACESAARVMDCGVWGCAYGACQQLKAH